MFSNCSLRIFSSRFYSTNIKDVCGSSEFLFSSMFVGRFSYLVNNFYVTAGSVGVLFFPGSPGNSWKNKFSEHVPKCVNSSRPVMSFVVGCISNDNILLITLFSTYTNLNYHCGRWDTGWGELQHNGREGVLHRAVIWGCI